MDSFFGAGIGASMFGRLQPPQMGPSAEDMEKERQRVLARRHVKVRGHHVRIFDMHKPKDVKAYEKLMGELVVGAQALTHMIWENEKQLVTTAEGQRWMRYIEWSEFELKVEPTAPVGTRKD